MSAAAAKIERVDVEVYTVGTPEPEADGTLRWGATTAVVVHIHAGGATGMGWTYSSPAAAAVITEQLAAVVGGRNPFDIAGAWQAMQRSCRNFGVRGLVMQALSAVDIALWDLKARLCDEPLTALLGQVRPAVPIYGSGGFTTLDDSQLARAGRDLARRRLSRDEDQDRAGLGRRHRPRSAAGPSTAGVRRR